MLSWVEHEKSFITSGQLFIPVTFTSPVHFHAFMNPDKKPIQIVTGILIIFLQIMWVFIKNYVIEAIPVSMVNVLKFE